MHIDRRALITGAAATMGLSAAPAFAQPYAPLPVVLKPSLTSALKDRPRVAVGAYGVCYMLGSKTSANSGWGAHVRLMTILNGLDEATAQRIADEAHADLLAQLAAQGLDVVPADETRAAMEAAAVPLTPDNRLYREGDLDGKSKRKWVTLGAKAAPLLPGASGEGPTNMMAGQKSIRQIAKASAAINAVVLNPVLWLDYIKIESSGNRVYRTTAEIRSGVRLSVLVQSSFWPHGSNKAGGWMGARLDMPKAVESPAVIASRELGAGGDPGGLASYIGEARGDLVHLDLDNWIPAAQSAYRGYNAAISGEAKKFPRG